MNLWQCPHPALFLKEICSNLEKVDTHCIVSLPERLIPSFQEELCAYWGDIWGDLPILTLDEETELTNAMSPYFATEDPITNLMGLTECVLRGSSTLAVVLTEKPHSKEQEFFCFLNYLAAHAKNSRDNGHCLNWNMLVIAPADRPIPNPDVGLRCFYWWGHLHNSDVEYAIEFAFKDIFRNGTHQEKLAYWWLYPLCKGLSSGDPELVEHIIRDFPRDIETLIATLKKHELNTEENGQLVRNFLEAPQYTPKSNDYPRGILAKLWHKGIIDLDCSGRLAIHPAALLAAGQVENLEELVIRGQMFFFLPLVQDVHNLLSRRVEKHLGNVLEEFFPEDGAFDSARYEIGPFYAFLSYLYKEKGKSVPYHILDTAKKWRELRNDIAHIKMLSCQTIECALAAYENLLKMN